MTTCPNCAEPPDAAVTVRLAVPDLVSLVAVIVTVPWATPWARPPDEIVATAVLLDAQATGRPVRMFPFASLSVAVNGAPGPGGPGGGGPLSDAVNWKANLVRMWFIPPKWPGPLPPLARLGTRSRS